MILGIIVDIVLAIVMAFITINGINSKLCLRKGTRTALSESDEVKSIAGLNTAVPAPYAKLKKFITIKKRTKQTLLNPYISLLFYFVSLIFIASLNSLLTLAIIWVLSRPYSKCLMFIRTN